MSVVPFLTHLCAPWSRLYDDSKLVSTVVTFAHIGGLMFGGGCAIAADRETLRLRTDDARLRQEHLEEIDAIHKPVLIGLGIVFLSGLLQLAADIETFFGSPIFWIKMGLVVVLLLNGFLFERTETALRVGRMTLEHGWGRLRRAAWRSLALWFGTALLGTALLSI